MEVNSQSSLLTRDRVLHSASQTVHLELWDSTLDQRACHHQGHISCYVSAMTQLEDMGRQHLGHAQIRSTPAPEWKGSIEVNSSWFRSGGERFTKGAGESSHAGRG